MADRSPKEPDPRDPVQDELERRRVRDALLAGRPVGISQTGSVSVNVGASTSPRIITAPGKFASFHWYERDPSLLKLETSAMGMYFPHFDLFESTNGQLYWTGVLMGRLTKAFQQWRVMAIYAHNHPANNAYGGSVKVFSIEPDLWDLQRTLGSAIPHLYMVDKRLYICTSRPEDFWATDHRSASAATALAWAAKWIAAFQLWQAGEISTAQFASDEI